MKRRSSRWSILFLLPLALLAGARQDARRQARLDLLGRDYSRALRHLDRALEEARKDPAKARDRERLLYLRANTLFLAGKTREAAEAFESLRKESPDGVYRRLARFGRARAEAASGNFQEAASVYREEVARLLAPERRLALAEVYLARAREALARTPPDRRTAIVFHDLAVDLELPRKKRFELLRRAARLAFEAGNFQDARRRFEALVNEVRGRIFGKSGEDPAHEDRLFLARCWRRTSAVPSARRLCEDLLREDLPAALRPEVLFELAQCQQGSSGLARTADLLRKFLETFGLHEKAPEAAWQLARVQQRLGLLEASLATLEDLQKRFPTAGPKVLARAAAERGAVLGRLQRFDEAIAAWKTYLARFPADPRWKEAQRAIVDLELGKAEGLAAKGKDSYESARKLFLAFLERHPLDARAPRILLRLGIMREEVERYEDARRDYERCASKHEGTAEASEAAYRIGRLLEGKLFDYPAAVEAYRKVKGPFAAKARRRLEELRRKSLALRTERSFRRGEKPFLKLRSRNIPKLRVRLYKLDYESFFRGTLGSGSIESLAIEAISPDSSFDFEVRDYEPFRETEVEIPIPAEGAGAYLVKVDEEDLAATTLVLVTDLAVVTKASRKELFVFTQDLARDLPKPGVRLLVTDGRKILAEGTTDERGVWRLRGKVVREAPRLHVFAIGPEGNGATTLDLNGLREGRGLAAKAHLFSDRPLYRPGDSLSAKAVLRDVKEGRYVLPADRTYAFEFLDAFGRLISRRERKPSPFGSLTAEFRIPAEAAAGSFTLRVLDSETGRILATRTVEVDRFQAPRVSMEVRSPRTTLVRGEPIEGKIRARYFFGGPVVDRRIEVRTTIAGRPRILEGRTDRAGEFPFRFETGEALDGASLTVVATIPEERAGVQEVFRIERTGFRLRSSLPAKVYLVGEDLEVEVVAESHDGEPLVRELEAELHRLRKRNGTVVEIPAGRTNLKTRAADGRGYASFDLKEGGDYRVRVFGKDRFGQVIETSADLFVSGKEDKVKLRLLSRVQHAKVGDELGIRLVNRVREGLVLLTIEGDGVLEFETRRIPVGETRIRLPLKTLHAPNFAYAATLLAGSRMHAARRDFRVRVPLQVEVKPRAETLKTGEKLVVDLRARDPLGRPVAAEFSLSIVDKALLQLRGRKGPGIYEVFYGEGIRRSTNMRTASSNTFRYEAKTRKVDRNLREEEVRKKLEEKLRKVWKGERGERGLFAAKRASRPTGVPKGGGAYRGPAKAPAASPSAMNDAIGLGGGAGGAFGGRFGGRVARRRSVGGERAQQAAAEEAEILFPYGMDAQIERQTLALDSRSMNGLLNAFLFVDEDGADLPPVRTVTGSRGRDGRGGNGPLPGDLSVFRGIVRAGEDGKAEVEISLPAHAGAWELHVIGLGGEELFGEARAEVRTRDDLVLRAALPPVWTQGDRAEGRIELHAAAGRPFDGTLEVREGGKERVKEGIEVPAGGVLRRFFSLDAETPGFTRVSALARAGSGTRASLQRRVEIQPWGIEERRGAAGLLSGERSVELALPKGREWNGLECIVTVAPLSLEEVLSSGAIRRPNQLTYNCIDWVPPTATNLAAEGLGVLELYLHYAATRPSDQGRIHRLRARVEALLASLMSGESEGRMPWIGKGHGSLGDTKAGLLSWLLAVRASKAGIPVDPGLLDRFRKRLAGLVRSRDSDLATLAFLVEAEAGLADFGRYNSLARRRTTLSLGALGRLALAARAMGRPGLASELEPGLAAKLEARIGGAEPDREDRKIRPLPPSSRKASVLWAALALAEGRGHEALCKRVETWLFENRRPRGFGSRIVHALAVSFLAKRRVAAGATAERVVILADDGAFRREVDFRKEPRGRRFRLPSSALARGRVRLVLRSSGRGKVSWTAVLRGLTKGLPEGGDSPNLKRRYLQAPLLLDGRPVPQGFRVVDKGVKTWKNESDRLVVGGFLDVELEFDPGSEERARLGSFILEEPLPAGSMVLGSEIQGNHDHFEVGPGFLRFYVHRSVGNVRIRYRLRAAMPGVWKVLPTRIFSLDDLGLSLRGKPAKITILPPGSKVETARRPTPDELYHSGLMLYAAAGRRALERDPATRDRVAAPLETLFRDFGPSLKEGPFKEIARRLLEISLLRGDHEWTIRLFEALKDRDPDWVLGFEDMAKVADAYYRNGEFERALHVSQAICEASFLREVQIAGKLQARGEVLEALRFFRDLFMNFPGLPEIRGAMFSLAQSLNSRARTLDPLRALDPKVGAPTLLRRTARDLCYEFLVRYPEDAEADEVAYSLASIALEEDRYDEALDILRRASKTYASSPWLDDFLYLYGYALFKKGAFDEALKILARVGSEEFPTKGGGRGPSENRWLAVFLQGQIHHAAGRPKEALEAYGKVEDRFLDAREAAGFFKRKRLEVPEVTLCAPGEGAKVRLRWRNLASIALTVYKVDLMRLYLLRKSLSDMGHVQLFGISPTWKKTFRLAEGEDFKDHEREFDLPLSAEGSYLVLASSGELKSSGLLLRTDLSIEAQEMPEENRLRVNVRKGGRFLPKARVKVVGDRDREIRSGVTDLRGIYVCDGLSGRATVLVEAGGSYAFYRSKASFGTPVHRKKERIYKDRKSLRKGDRGFDALEKNSLQLKRLEDKQNSRLEQLLKNKQKGVELRRTK